MAVSKNLAKHFCLLQGVFWMVVGASSNLDAQTVQLPTFRNFSVDTTVLAPDRGSAHLGSNPSYRWGGVSRGGIPMNRGVGGGIVLPGSSVHVSIIDLDELDEAILAAAKGESLAAQRLLGGTGARGVGPISGGSVASTGGSGMARSSSATSSPSQTPPGPTPTMSSRANSASSTIPQRRYVPGDSRLPPIPSYAYMAMMNHPNDAALQKELSEDLRHYVGMAKSAREGGHWSTVQLFYEEAWSRLRADQQAQILEAIQTKKLDSAPSDVTGSRAR